MLGQTNLPNEELRSKSALSLSLKDSNENSILDPLTPSETDSTSTETLSLVNSSLNYKESLQQLLQKRHSSDLSLHSYAQSLLGNHTKTPPSCTDTSRSCTWLVSA